METLTDVRREAADLLRRHGLTGNDVSVADGFANVVLLTDQYVVRLNNGRFPEAFAHEASVLARLPAAVPHPAPVAHGTRKKGGEYLILERLPGVDLETAWPDLSEADRRMVGVQLGQIIRTLHELPLADWMTNPWVERVISIGLWGDAYHAPPCHYRDMIESAATSRPDLRALLNDVRGFIEERPSALELQAVVFTHTDLHFRNVIVEGGTVTGLIDFEGSRPGPADTELDMLLRSMTSRTQDDANRRSAILGPMAEVHPDLFASRNLMPRLEVQEALWLLVQLHHWRQGQQWMDDPGLALRELLAGTFQEGIRALLQDVPSS